MKALILTILVGIIGSAHAYHTIRVDELTEELILPIAKGEMPDLVVEVPKGMALPFALRVEGDLIALLAAQPPEYQVQAKQRFFFRVDGDEWLFSIDGNEWETMIPFATGTFGCSIGAAGAGPYVEVWLEANKRP